MAQKKFDFIIKLLEDEKDKHVGKAVKMYMKYNKLVLDPRTEKIKALTKAIEILTNENKTR